MSVGPTTTSGIPTSFASSCFSAIFCVVLALEHPGTLDVCAVWQQPVSPLGASWIERRVRWPLGFAFVRESVGREPVVDGLLQQRPAAVAIVGVTAGAE
jgi:hypothetical protein